MPNDGGSLKIPRARIANPNPIKANPPARHVLNIPPV